MAGSLPKKGRVACQPGRSSVRKIKKVLRLKFDVGLGLRHIARSCSIGLGTVAGQRPFLISERDILRPMTEDLDRITTPYYVVR